MGKHTPGRWVVEPDTGNIISLNQAEPICQMDSPSMLSGGLAEQNANAALIVAAPELLAALKAVADVVARPDDNWQRRILDAALPAIATAEGSK